MAVTTPPQIQATDSQALAPSVSGAKSP